MWWGSVPLALGVWELICRPWRDTEMQRDRARFAGGNGDLFGKQKEDGVGLGEGAALRTECLAVSQQRGQADGPTATKPIFILALSLHPVPGLIEACTSPGLKMEAWGAHSIY